MTERDSLFSFLRRAWLRLTHRCLCGDKVEQHGWCAGCLEYPDA